MWNQWFRAALIGGCVLTFSGCGNVKTARAPGGGFLITCNKGMSQCISAADKACAEKGYTILEGASHTKILGGQTSSYQKRSDTGQLIIKCGEVEIEPKEDCYRLPERTDAPIETPPPASNSGASSKCIPGATQMCVGPGACQGGQICAADGQGFGACDCGGAPAARSPSPAAPSSSAGTAPKESPAPEIPSLPGAVPPPEPLNQK